MKKLILTSLHYIGIIAIVFISSCNAPNKSETKATTPQERAKESILSWMDNSKDEYPKYQPIEFREITARYERTDRTYQLNDLIEIEKAKPVINQKVIDSLIDLQSKNKGLFLGYIIQHKYQTTTNAGEIIKEEKLFFLDTSFRVLTILNLDAFDMILDEKLLFRPDSTVK